LALLQLFGVDADPPWQVVIRGWRLKPHSTHTPQ